MLIKSADTVEGWSAKVGRDISLSGLTDANTSAGGTEFPTLVDTDGTNGVYYTMRLVRNSDSTIFIGDQNPSATSQSRGAFGTYQASSVNAMTVAQSFLDSPNTTSATTYKLQAHCPYSSSYTIGINTSPVQDNYTYMTNCVSTITAMEIAA